MEKKRGGGGDRNNKHSRNLILMAIIIGISE